MKGGFLFVYVLATIIHYFPLATSRCQRIRWMQLHQQKPWALLDEVFEFVDSFKRYICNHIIFMCKYLIFKGNIYPVYLDTWVKNKSKAYSYFKFLANSLCASFTLNSTKSYACGSLKHRPLNYQTLMCCPVLKNRLALISIWNNHCAERILKSFKVEFVFLSNIKCKIQTHMEK